MGYRTQPARCGLCGSPIDGAGPEPLACGLCAPCGDGRRGPWLVALGLHLRIAELRTKTDAGDNDLYDDLLVVQAAVGCELPLRATFAREGLLGRLLARDLQLGDPTFDRAVEVRGDDPALLRELLADEAVRLAVMQIVARGPTTIQLAAGAFTFTCAGQRDEVWRSSALLLGALARCARSRGLPLRPRPPLPLRAALVAAQLVADAERLIEQVSERTELLSLDLRGDRLDPRELAALPSPRALVLADLELAPDDPTPIGGLRLRHLALARLPQLCSIDWVERMTDLESLALAGCPVEQIRALARLPSLRALDLSGTGVRDLSPLHELARLEELTLTGAPVPTEEVARLTARRPALRVRRRRPRPARRRLGPRAPLLRAADRSEAAHRVRPSPTTRSWIQGSRPGAR